MSTHGRGEIWWGEIEDLGRRPFLIMTRPSAIPVLHQLVAAPVTRTIRNIPTELRMGPDDGMPQDCAASFDNLRVVSKALLVERICTLGPDRLAQACTALRTALAC
ncbi:MAG: type II toxin-antitoxin system PemK/MazF family toxin [bacterium]|nr:type II toxin-antitoxin system PemK/MazF family toxin [bacterium]MCY4271159.1 type II toxin-antitoxin system PemK/MazF family toxin [bacterium]